MPARSAGAAGSVGAVERRRPPPAARRRRSARRRCGRRCAAAARQRRSARRARPAARCAARAASARRARAATAAAPARTRLTTSAVDAQPVQRQRGERAPGLGGDHPLRGEDEPDRGAVVVGEHRAQPAELLGEPVEGVDRAVPAGGGVAPAPGQARRAGRARPGGARGTAAPGSPTAPRAARAAAASRRWARSRRPRPPTARAPRRGAPRRARAGPRRPGSTVSSSATSSSTPGPGQQVRRWPCSCAHASSSRAWVSMWAAYRPRSSSAGSPPSSASSASPRECAGSVETTSALRPDRASWAAVAAASVVLPTPPLPVNSTTRTERRLVR